MAEGKESPERDGPLLPGRTRLLSSENGEAEQLMSVAKALGSPQRIRILECLAHRTANVSEIAEILKMPLATVNLHLNRLEEAGLIRTEMVSARRGQQRMCARVVDVVVLHLPDNLEAQDREKVSLSMPVGAFVSHRVAPTCGMVGAGGLIGDMDDPISFYEPGRFEAQLVWFSHGYVEYRFPYRLERNRQPSRLQLSLELCSEAVPHHLEWLSDIYVEINGVDIGTWTSPSDFGGERGRLTPAWWKDHNTQYGLLKTWRVDGGGTFVDGRPLSAVTVADLKLTESLAVGVRVGVRADALHVGGVNIFGQGFGNHAQDILLELFY